MQQPSETSTNQCELIKTNNDSTIYYTQEKSKTTVASPTLPPKGPQPENYVVTTQHPPGNQTGNEPVPFLNCSKNRPNDVQNSKQHVTTKLIGDTTVLPLTTTTPVIEEGLVTDEQTNEVYLPLTSAVVLKKKQEMLYVPLDFEKNLTVDASVDSRAYVRAIVQNDLDTIKQKITKYFLGFDNPPVFQTQEPNGQSRKPLATTTLRFEIAYNNFAENFLY